MASRDARVVAGRKRRSTSHADIRKGVLRFWSVRAAAENYASEDDCRLNR